MIWSNDVISYITSRQLTIIRYSDMPILTIVEPWVCFTHDVFTTLYMYLRSKNDGFKIIKYRQFTRLLFLTGKERSFSLQF